MKTKTEMKSKQYLAAANEKIGPVWQLRESMRMAASGAPTFSMYVVLGCPAYDEHVWLVYASQPRHLLRNLAEDVATRGLIALTDPEHGTYTSRVRMSGYGFETIGLREALVNADPAMRAVVDSEFNCAYWAFPWECPRDMVEGTIEADGQRGIHVRPEAFAEVEARMGGLKAVGFTERYVFFRVYKPEEVPAAVPPEAIPLNFKPIAEVLSAQAPA